MGQGSTQRRLSLKPRLPTLKSKLQTLYPNPQTPSPKPFTLNPRTHIPHPTPHTPNFKTHTPNPKTQTLNQGRMAWGGPETHSRRRGLTTGPPVLTKRETFAGFAEAWLQGSKDAPSKRGSALGGMGLDESGSGGVRVPKLLWGLIAHLMGESWG